MLRKKSEAVSEGNGPVHQQDEFGSGQPTLVDPSRKIEEILDRRIDVTTGLLEHHLTSLEEDARQPRLVMAAGGPADTKTRERTEGTTTAGQAKHGDSCTAQRFETDRKPRPGSAWWPNLPISLSGMTFWPRTALRRPNRVSHHWRCRTNSRWWLTSQQRSLYSYGDRL